MNLSYMHINKFSKAGHPRLIHIMSYLEEHNMNEHIHLMLHILNIYVIKFTLISNNVK